MRELGTAGADTADLYFQHQRLNSIALEAGTISRAGSRIQQGVGIRSAVGDQTGYAFTEDISLPSMLARVQQTVEVGKKAGADDVFATVSRSRAVEFSWRDGKLETVKDTTSRSLVVRLFVQGRYSSHTTTDLDPDRIAVFVGRTLALTRALESDHHRKITPPELYAWRSQRDLQLFAPRVQALSREQRLA